MEPLAQLRHDFGSERTVAGQCPDGIARQRVHQTVDEQRCPDENGYREQQPLGDVAEETGALPELSDVAQHGGHCTTSTSAYSIQSWMPILTLRTRLECTAWLTS
ncbi:Uncharacterised protein [Mycobacteroides abscessus subsp. abscessus]|nr:Uncharacterised protein [Mycobacteroides abscessus subsp. abscessus]